MRIDLTTTYPERHEAKALGARWDVSKRVWYVIDPQDLTPFLRWIATEKLQSGSSVVPTDRLGTKDGHRRPTKPAVTAELMRAQVQPLHLYSAGTTELAKVEKFNRRKRITGPAYVPHCGCDVLPWDHCAHTEPTEIAGTLQ